MQITTEAPTLAATIISSFDYLRKSSYATEFLGIPEMQAENPLLSLACATLLGVNSGLFTNALAKDLMNRNFTRGAISSALLITATFHAVILTKNDIELISVGVGFGIGFLGSAFNDLRNAHHTTNHGHRRTA